MMAARFGEREDGSYFLVITQFQFWSMRKVLGLDGEDGCKTM